jgi:hypothetical protein
MSMYTFIHNLLNVLVQIANKMGLKKSCYQMSYMPLVVGPLITGAQLVRRAWHFHTQEAARSALSRYSNFFYKESKV